jgi:SAM-dependent methyltransferase
MSTLDVEGIDWQMLRDVRTLFLDGTAGASDYWTSDELVGNYDRTFGERIGWKWDHVLDQLAILGWRPPPGPVLDWGCGTGTAGRRTLQRFDIGPLMLHDRSTRAVRYAQAQASNAGIEVVDAGEPTTLLVSHVISELPERDRLRVMAIAEQAQCVIWVEPGDHSSSRALIDVREALAGELHVVAPCTHGRRCWMLDAGNERHWCHHFAEPPPEVFTDPGWGRFASEIGIDPRAVALSYLVLDRRPVAARSSGSVRLIGRPRVNKAEAVVFGCDANGLTDARIVKRSHPDAYRSAKKGRMATLAEWRVSGTTVEELHEAT